MPQEVFIINKLSFSVMCDFFILKKKAKNAIIQDITANRKLEKHEPKSRGCYKYTGHKALKR